MTNSGFKRKEEDRSPVEDREEDEDNENCHKGIELSKNGGRLQVYKREKEDSLPVGYRKEDDERLGTIPGR